MKNWFSWVGQSIVLGSLLAGTVAVGGAIADPETNTNQSKQMIVVSRRANCTTWAEFVQQLPSEGGRGGQWWRYGKLPNKFYNGCVIVSNNNSLDLGYVFQTGLDSNPYSNDSGDYGSIIPAPNRDNESKNSSLDKFVAQGKLVLITWLTPTNGAIPYLRSIQHDRPFLRNDGMTCLSTVCLMSGGLSHRQLSEILQPTQRPMPIEEPISKPPVQFTPIVPPQPLTSRPPNAQEIALLDRTIQGSKVPSLSRSQNIDRQTLQSKSSKFLKPFAGGWLSADNQKYYIYPSKRKDRQACIIIEKDGTQDLQIGVANGNNIGTDINIGTARMFKTQDSKIVALRVPGRDALVALYASAISVNITPGNLEMMEQNNCMTSLSQFK